MFCNFLPLVGLFVRARSLIFIACDIRRVFIFNSFFFFFYSFFFPEGSKSITKNVYELE